MSRYNINKKTLLIAASVILLCIVSVTGATLALFTSTNDGKIGINTTSGDLEVDIVDASDNPQSLVGDTLDFVTTSNNREVLFEPGAMYYTEGFRVKNIGEISLKYIVYISGEGESDEGLSFSQAFEAWITTDPTNRSDMVRMQDFSGVLKKDESSEVYYLVFRMKEEAGNEYQGKSFTGVGITVCAVQMNGYIEIDKGD